MLALILWVVISHYVADFWLQTEWQAINKSKSNKALLSHILTYSVSVTVFIFSFSLFNNGIFSIHQFWWFVIITFICHFVTDYITSRESSKLYEQKKMRQFWRVIGFDQLLHYTQLFITLRLLKLI